MDDNPTRIFRGGSWYTLPSRVRVSKRLRNALGARNDVLGVRLVRVINPLQQIVETNDGE